MVPQRLAQGACGMLGIFCPDLCAGCVGVFRMTAAGELHVLRAGKCTRDQCPTPIEIHMHYMSIIQSAEGGASRHRLL